MTKRHRPNQAEVEAGDAIQILQRTVPIAPTAYLRVPAVAQQMGDETPSQTLQDSAQGKRGDVAPLPPPGSPPTPQPPLPVYEKACNGSRRTGVMSYRFHEETLLSIARVAKERGVTQKRVINAALEAVGVKVHPADWATRPPPRRRMDEV